MVATFFERYEAQLCLSLFNLLSFAPVALPSSTALCFFLNYQFTYGNKNKSVKSFTIFHFYSPLFGDLEQFSFTIGIKENCIKHKEL